MSQDAQDRLKRTILFENLYDKENARHKGDHEISGALIQMVGHIAPLLDRIPEHMREYTLHDRNHSARVVEVMGQILPEDTLEHLNIVELAILIYAAYLHDLGMTATSEEREQIISSDPGYNKLLLEDEVRYNQIEQYKAQGEHRAATFVQDQVFTEYLRRTHVKRSEKLIGDMLKAGKLHISWQGSTYHRWVIAVCNAHAQPVRELRNPENDASRSDARVRTLRVNVQYLALVLRLADILDLDPERTPQSLLDFIDPRDPQSIIEWQKHRAIQGWEITPERIVFEAVCAGPQYERALREFLHMIETEREESLLLASSYRDDLAEKYRFELINPVTTEYIQSDGSYIYSDVQFTIDYRRVMELLMGQRLYQDPKLALRELLQNAVDAVRHREAMEHRAGQPFEPAIAVRLRGSTLIIEDNGIGMDEHIFKHYFIQVGRSYYTSPEFRARQFDIDPVSEFGIGILSVFMIADQFVVESLARPDSPTRPTQPVLFEVPTAYGYFVQRPSNREQIGTRITLTLKADHPFKADKLLPTIEELAPFIPYKVTVESNGQEQVYQPHAPGEYWGRPRKKDETVFFEVDFDADDSPALVGVRGAVRGISGGNFAKLIGVLAQRGFAIAHLVSHTISSNREREFPFPDWVSLWLSLDLHGDARLTLTPDRTRVLKDERWQRLDEAIEQKLIGALRQHLEEQQAQLAADAYAHYTHDLLEALSINPISELPEAVWDILRDLVPLPCLQAAGQVGYRTTADLLSEPLLLLANQNDWYFIVEPLEVCRAIERDLGFFPPVLLQGKGQRDTDVLINRSFSHKKGFISCSAPGLLLNVLQDRAGTCTSHPAGFFMTNRLNLTYNLHEPASQHRLLCAYMLNSFTLGLGFTLVWNARHPLLAPLLQDDQAGDEKCEELLRYFDNSFDEIMRSLSDDLDFDVGADASGRRVKLPDQWNVRLVGVFRRVPWLLGAFQRVAEAHWQSMQRAGVVATDAPCPELTERDFPWFWSREKWEEG